MAAKIPIVLDDGEFEQLALTDKLADNTVIFKALNSSSDIVVGTVMQIKAADGSIHQAVANDTDAAKAVFVAFENILGNEIGYFQSHGIVTGLAGLTSGATYYLSPTTVGLITSTIPTTPGQFVVLLGIAISTTELYLNIQRPIKLA